MNITKILCKNWWIKSLMRAFRTFFTTYISMLPLEAGIEGIDYKLIAITSLCNAGLSLIGCIISLPEYNLENNDINLLEESRIMTEKIKED